MNRRIFLKTTAAVVATTTVGIPTIKKTESKWIAFKDQMPKATDKFEIKNNRTGEVRKGEVLEFDVEVEGEKGIHILYVSDKKTFLYTNDKKTFILYKETENSNIVIEQHRWHWRYA